MAFVKATPLTKRTASQVWFHLPALRVGGQVSWLLPSSLSGAPGALQPRQTGPELIAALPAAAHCLVNGPAFKLSSLQPADTRSSAIHSIRLPWLQADSPGAFDYHWFLLHAYFQHICHKLLQLVQRLFATDSLSFPSGLLSRTLFVFHVLTYI